MGAIKIGEVEERLISDIERLKQSQKIRMEAVLLGIQLTRQQIHDTEKGNNEEIVNEIIRARNYVRYLNSAIQGIKFSKKFDEKEFSIAWSEYNDKHETYTEYVFGKTITGENVTEKQFIFALLSWEREVCKRLAQVRETEGNVYESICADIEQSIRNLLYTYVQHN